MKFNKITVTLLTLATVTMLPVVASAQSGNRTKIAQCNQIIRIANTAVRETKAITNSGQPSSPQAMLKAADAMDSAARQMENLSIADRTLQSYRSRFITMYRQTSKATRNFARAYNQKDREQSELALRDLQNATAPEKQIVADINTYCLK